MPNRNTFGLGRYVAGALLLGRDNPSHVIACSSQPLMRPMDDYESSGFVPNVVFPTAMLDRGDTQQVYCGAADTCVAVARFSKRSIVESLLLPGDRKP